MFVVWLNPPKQLILMSCHFEGYFWGADGFCSGEVISDCLSERRTKRQHFFENPDSFQDLGLIRLKFEPIKHQ